MSVQWYAGLVVIVGLCLWLMGDVLGSVVALLFFTLFGGGAAFLIGVTSIQPTSFFLIFLLAHVLLSMFQRTNHVKLGLETNGYLAFLCIYSAIAAMILPKLFFRHMILPPVLINAHDVYYVAPLGPSRQNLTTAIYLIGTLLASICAAAASADPRSRRTIVTWSVVIAWAHIAFGVFGVIATKVGGTAIIGFFRNAKYAELNEVTQGFVRIDGIFPEPSSYGAYAFVWFVFMVELWLRQIRPSWTGAAAAALLIVLMFCTSTSAYFGMAVYAAVMLVRWVIASGGLRQTKLLILALSGLTAVTAALAAMALAPSIATLASRVLTSVTLHKLDSTSGLQRTFWIKAGLTAFIKSYGLGVGAGSFRSSSLIVAILGSSGVIGAVAFVGHIVKVMRPLRADTYLLSRAARDPVGASAAWAACAGLLPAMVSAPTMDPGVLFGVLGGLALGWRLTADRGQVSASRSARGAVAAPDLAGAVAT
jgi:hypothetical protein